MIEAPPAIPVEDNLYPDISDIDYHADRTSLSSSGARELLKLPARFHWQQSQPPIRKRVYDTGHYVHAEILGVGMEVEVIDAANYQTKAAKEARDAAYAADKIPMLPHEKAAADDMVKSVLAHPTVANLLEDGTPELSGYWHDLATGERLRARPDWLREFPDGRRPIIGDVKTTGTSAAPEEFGSTAAKWGLEFQAAWYIAMIRAIGLHEDAAFIFINVEKDPPHFVSLTQLTTRALDRGGVRMRRAVDLYHQCKTSGVWPDYGPEIHTCDLPAYAYYRD